MLVGAQMPVRNFGSIFANLSHMSRLLGSLKTGLTILMRHNLPLAYDNPSSGKTHVLIGSANLNWQRCSLRLKS
jgi:hypothetical protein